jgi:acyl carrier protein
MKYEERGRMGYEIIHTIRRFFIDQAWLTDEDGVLESDSLLEKGVIDSMAMVELIAYVEQTYNINIQEDELMPENFDSLAAIAAFIDAKRNGA